MKTPKLATRLLLISLCLLLTVSLLAACQSSEEQPPVKTQSTGVKTTVEGGLVDDRLPEDLNFNRGVKILACEQQAYHFYAEDTTEDVINNVIYDRNETVMDRLGIELTWIKRPGTFPEREDFIKAVQQSQSDGNVYDACICYNLVPYAMAAKGLTANLYDTKHIDLTAPWWPKTYLEAGVYKEQIYGLVESCGYGTLERMIATFFNTDLIEDKRLESPYTLVANNKWTFDQMMTMIKDSHVDKLNDGKTNDDFYGLVTGTSPMLDSWFFALGNRYSKLNANGELELVLSDPSLGDYFEKINDAFSSADVMLYDRNGHTKTFVSENAIFYNTIVGMTSTLKDIDIAYGIVPTPKASSDSSYYTHLGNTHDAWCIPTGVKDMDCSSALLECMASESYRQINPVYFEAMLKLRYAQDERIAAMYDLIRENIGFDFCYLYATAFDSDIIPCEVLRKCVTSPTQNKWTDVWGRQGERISTQFQTIVDLYSK